MNGEFTFLTENQMLVVSVEAQIPSTTSKIEKMAPFLFQILEKEKGITFDFHRNYLICTSLDRTSRGELHYVATSFDLETGESWIDSSCLYESPEEAIAEVKELLDSELDRRAVATHLQKLLETLKEEGFDEVKFLDGLTLFAYENQKLNHVQPLIEEAWERLAYPQPVSC